jgi:hypothetical protein
MPFDRWWPILAFSLLLPQIANAQAPPGSPANLPAPSDLGHPLSAPLPLTTPSPVTSAPFLEQSTVDPYNSLIWSADSLLTENGGKYVLQGDVRVRYRGYTLTSDRADVDLDRRTALFTGNVVLLTPNGQTVQGGPYGSLALDLRTSTYTITGAKTTVPPQDLPLGIILPIYIYGGTISGRPGFIEARGSQFTTCDFSDPHYSFGAKQLYLVPGRHLVGKYVTYYRDGHRLLTIPYVYLPIDGRLEQSQIIPQVGETPELGYFADVAIGYALSPTLPGLLTLDLSQKQGLGTGFQQAYGNLSKPHEGSGVASGFYQHDNSTDENTITYGLNHQQLFGTVQATLNTQGQQNSYFVGTGNSLSNNTQLNLSRNVGNDQTMLQNNLTQNNYGQGLSQTLTSELDNIFEPDHNERLETKFNYSGVTQPSSTGQQELDSSVDYTQQGKAVDWEFLANNYSQLSGNSIGYGGLERLPEVRLTTDGTQMPFLRDLLLPRSTAVRLSLGEFNEPSSGTSTDRVFFGLDTGETTKTSGRNSVQYGGTFNQAFYGDNTAQYSLAGNASYRLRIGNRSDAGVTYTYLRPYGYTPFQFDFVGTTNNAALNLSYQETRQFQLTLASAYDFNETRSIDGQSPTPWQNLAAEVLFTPAKTFQLQTTSAYDPNHGKLLDLTNNLIINIPHGPSLSLATMYDPVSYRFSQTNYSVSIPFWRDRNPAEESEYRIQAIGGYDGITDQFSYEGFALTRTWHDWEAVLAYQNDNTDSLVSGQTITFNFQLKAFPAYQPFGVGAFGEGLDSGIGPVY